jgi:microcystin degradation protein MlrC
MRRLLAGARPATAFASVPILAVPGRQGTDDLPMRELLARVHAIEADPRVLVVTLAGGFCYSDVPEAGIAIVVSTDGDPVLASAYAAELQALAWAQRDAFVQRNLAPAEAVRLALAAPPGRPAILVDGPDNIGGGAPGDGTVLLAELLRQGATEAAVVIADPEAVAAAYSAGVGGAFAGDVGGKTDRFHGDPVPVRGTVRLLADGRFTYRGSYMTGQERSMGLTAVLDVAGNHLVLTERKTMPFDAQHLRAVGISPEWCRAIVVKSATAWRAAFADIAGPVYEADTPGICTTNLANLPYQHLRRPIFPLDPTETIPLPPVDVAKRP